MACTGNTTLKENAELNIVRELKKILTKEEQRLNSLRINALNITPVIDGLPHAKTAQSKVERNALRIIESEQEVETLRAEMVQAKSTLADKIMSQVDEPNYQTLLVLRYVECLSFREIARRMHFVLRNLFNLHDAALENFS